MDLSVFAISLSCDCSPTLMKRPNREEQSIYGLTNLLTQLQKEFRLSSQTPKSSTEIIKGTESQNSDGSHPILSPTLRPSAKARGLPLFDRSTHLVWSRLPLS
jgi:hypothetical protein